MAFVCVIGGYLLAVSVAGGGSQAVIDAVSTAARYGLLAGIVAIGAAGFTLRGRLQKLQDGSTTDLGSFNRALESGDSSRALDAAMALGISSEAYSKLSRMLASDSAEASGSTVERGTGIVDQQSIERLSENIEKQLSSVTELSGLLDVGRTADRNISDSVEGLSRSAESTSSSILEMVAINNEVTENIHGLSMSVQETTSAIEEMTFSVKEVAKNIEELSTAAEETAASMNQMDVSISQVETNANETSKLSETVTGDAETGVNAINRTIQGIDKIKDSSRIAAEVITTLGQKINEIGNILTVIDDVAEQTNLLALNAAIIAAQAGEHGRGFAVVADEIKALAERTGSSTKEIADLIKTVQDESRNAISVMSQGVDDVEEGVRLGHDAEDALRKIVESAKRSTLMIKAIAQATVEQSKGSKQVTNAISRIAETVQQIALATAEQAKGAEQIMKSAEHMKVLTQQVERSTEEQNRGGRQMTEAMENIREIVDQINSAQNQQRDGYVRVEQGAVAAQRASSAAVAALGELRSMLSDSV